MPDVIAEAYALASNAVRPLMGDIPDGHIAVGAMDGFVAVIPSLDDELRRIDRTRGFVEGVNADGTSFAELDGAGLHGTRRQD